MIKIDIWISKTAQKGMINPFEASLIRKITCDEGSLTRRVISYGLSSYGYDIRLSPTEFRIFRHIPGTVVDPKNFKEQNLESTALHSSVDGDYFILPAHSYGLGVALERLEIPDNISVICIGKSTYANEGVVQLLFLEGEPCAISYEARQGKYQDQPEKVTIARI